VAEMIASQPGKKEIVHDFLAEDKETSIAIEAELTGKTTLGWCMDKFRSLCTRMRCLWKW
jgi:hypothetical protein